MFFTLFFISLWVMNFTLNRNWPCPCLCFGTQKACIKPRWTFLSEELCFFPQCSGSFMSECFLLCWSHVDCSNKALFHFKICSRRESFLLGILWRYNQTSHFVFLQGNSTLFLLWDHLIFCCNMYDYYRDGVGLKQLAHHNQQHRHTQKFMSSPSLDNSSTFTFSNRMHCFGFIPVLSSGLQNIHQHLQNILNQK